MPLFFWKRSDSDSYTVLMPLFAEWRRKSGNVETSSFLAGPMFLPPGPPPGPPGSLAALTLQATTGTVPADTADAVHGDLDDVWHPAAALYPSLAGAHAGRGPGFGYSRTAERRTLLIGPYVETVGNPGQPGQSISRALFPLYYFHCSPGRRAPSFFSRSTPTSATRTPRSVPCCGCTPRRQAWRALVAYRAAAVLFGTRPGRSDRPALLPPQRRAEGRAGFFGVLPLFGYWPQRQPEPD